MLSVYLGVTAEANDQKSKISVRMSGGGIVHRITLQSALDVASLILLSAFSSSHTVVILYRKSR
jgi:hypothetical protein